MNDRQRASIGLLAILLIAHPLLFRRGRNKPTREDAFREAFAVLGDVYERAAAMKPEWQTQWATRQQRTLPSRLSFGNQVAESAGYDVRFASALLHRNRWRSKVQPLFSQYDDDTWATFQDSAAQLSVQLLNVIDTHAERFRGDEIDWISDAVEQLDDATRRRARDVAVTPASTQVAEGVYQVLYITIQLSERLIDRLRFDADPDAYLALQPE